MVGVPEDAIRTIGLFLSLFRNVWTRFPRRCAPTQLRRRQVAVPCEWLLCSSTRHWELPFLGEVSLLAWKTLVLAVEPLTLSCVVYVSFSPPVTKFSRQKKFHTCLSAHMLLMAADHAIFLHHNSMPSQGHAGAGYVYRVTTLEFLWQLTSATSGTVLIQLQKALFIQRG